MRGRRSGGGRIWRAGWALVPLALATGACQEEDGPPAPQKSPEALAVEAKAGDFLAYYQEVIVLSRRHAAHPDSFQIAIRELPGSQLTVEEWEAWTEPYRDDARLLTVRLETTIANLGRGGG